MNEVIELDKEIFLFLNHLGSPGFDRFWVLMSEKWTWIPLYLVFFLILFKNFKFKSLVYILIFIGLGLVISDQLAGIFKNGIQRLRPCHDPGLEGLVREVKCGGQFGFYSAHASNVFFIATFMTQMLKERFGLFPYFLFFWASVVAFSRIYLGVHFPLDILMGAAVGFLLGGFFAALSWKVINKQKEK